MLGDSRQRLANSAIGGLRIYFESCMWQCNNSNFTTIQNDLRYYYGATILTQPLLYKEEGDKYS